jgi:hypothetical protein
MNGDPLDQHRYQIDLGEISESIPESM